MKTWNISYCNETLELMKKEALSGVYALILENDSVYVGSSVNIYQRIKQHERKGKKIKEVMLLELVDLNDKYPFNRKGWLMVRECLYYAEILKSGVELYNKAPWLFMTNINRNIKYNK